MGRLSTKDILSHIGVINDGLCNFCSETKTFGHMFFDCSITQNIWQDITFWVGYMRVPAGWNDERLWLIQETKNKGRRREIIKIVTTETIYSLYKGQEII